MEILCPNRKSFPTRKFCRIRYAPYLFEVFLFADVVEKSCICVGGGVIELRLCKKEEMVWGQLQSNIKS